MHTHHKTQNLANMLQYNGSCWCQKIFAHYFLIIFCKLIKQLHNSMDGLASSMLNRKQ